MTAPTHDRTARVMTMGAPAIAEVPTTPFADQRPGTSGLRKKTRTFMQPHYLENFVQAVFETIAEGTELSAETLVVGGDGRYYNLPAIQSILRMAIANGFGRVLVARGGLLSTPAMSAVIRKRMAVGGLILSASHNPGGIDADFGIKFNVRNGGPAPEDVTERIYQRTLQLRSYRTVALPDLDLERTLDWTFDGTRITVFDPVADYAELLERLFDFDALGRMLSGGFRIRFDAMHAATGPYAVHILEERLGASKGTVVRAQPLPDFGGGHPDPNLVHAHELVERMYADDAPDFGAACDGDGDRNLILGRGCFVSPGDSLALLAAHARRIPAFRGGLAGVARSMPTSTAVDRVAAAQGIPCYETPTGWKYFGDLMDAGLCGLCGEESFGTGADHIREKDGLWAVLCWLSVIATTGMSPAQALADHWRTFGRSYYQRHDFEGLEADAARAVIDALRERLPGLVGQAIAGTTVAQADDFAYRSPVTGAESAHGGIRLRLADGSRLVLRLSGTGTEGATLRMYIERYRRDGGPGDPAPLLAPLVEAGSALLQLRERFGREHATVIT